MRGYYGIGLEQSSKPMNAGNLFRTAHAFGASFLFTVNATYSVKDAKSDTSIAPRNIPWFDYDSASSLKLPKGCLLVGIEIHEEAVELPVFRHPMNAAYILGPEMGSLSPDVVERCSTLVRIPTRFSLNVATTGAIVMYDRLSCLEKHGERPVSILGESLPPLTHVQGGPVKRNKKKSDDGMGFQG